ncbi:modification methylase PaeR7I [Janthinobacterium sp. HH104]|uniref:BREX-2 system adenine-specific DNA-methyltransferase PglX n=1 Tax=Janthinobacterium sp. HH104 TaxID=1537276 RepID=UPI0008756BC8|nr:BREX-2 system adenine-specific DNA-methyltransferase PglX [Janthinobacterium sp. HH104]OEZ83350.1 modification methylase PaeR7I [Janthinobacterium sp. HH104]
MINAPQLLSDLTKLLKRLEGDILQRIEEIPEIRGSLQAEWQAARDAARCAETFETWADQVITQAGVHWLLSCVFLRFIEDNQLIDRPWLGGTPESGRLALVRDRHEAYFQAHPLENDRDYLLASFREAGALPGLHTFFDEVHNPAFRLGISGDAAMTVRQFWQQVDPNTGALRHDFTDPVWNTRFLGDLYQDLSEATRKRYALLQTPDFVEEFILDRTLTPAIREFGFRDVRLIDPTCGSGHFLLGGFHRVLAEWQRHEPGRNQVDIAQKALDAVAGVDLNPFAVAISRFRLFVAALQASGVKRLANAHDFQISVAIGDSLLHGTRFGLTQSQDLFDAVETHADTGLAHAYASEDIAEVQRILGRQYHAVVGNPPYIVVKDAALNAAYRRKYASCHMKYSLGAPFTERFFELAVTAVDGRSAGYVGLITANSFMKREFGSKLIEQVLPLLDLTHVVDTSGAYIPGHGTPTVILFGRNRRPVNDGVRTVMGIKGEPSTPDDPALGLVWSSIVNQIDHLGSESDFVSIADTSRTTFAKHPWSIAGGGAADVKEKIEGMRSTLGALAGSIGFASFTGTDEVFGVPATALRRKGFPEQSIRTFVVGDTVRDYQIGADDFAFTPYHADLSPFSLDPDSSWARAMWPYRASLEGVISFAGKTRKECGDQWWTWYRWVPSKYRDPLTITFAEVATHNHFVLDRGDKVFKQTAPVIKLPTGTSLDEHLALIGLLNSSVACFWMKQVSHQKQMMGGDGIRISEKSKVPFQFASTRLQQLPIPENWNSHVLKSRLIDLSREMDRLAHESSLLRASIVIENSLATDADVGKAWDDALVLRQLGRSNSILLQEEIDFLCYAMYGLAVDADLLSEPSSWSVQLEPGARPFCILGQKNVDGFDVPTSVPADWPEDMRAVWARRMQAIQNIPSLRTIEDPHYKRRWIGRQGLFNHGAKANEFTNALRDWMLNRLEAPEFWPSSIDQPPQLSSSSRLAEAVSHDVQFMQIATLYAGHTDFDLPQLVAELVAAESVPALPVQCYSDTGLRKRGQWHDTWSLQRREDGIDVQVVADIAEGLRVELGKDARQRFHIAAGKSLSEEAEAWVEQQLVAEIRRNQNERKATEIGSIPVPPKYTNKDFLKADFWRLRGGMDVPKERWISYLGCERGSDGSLVIAWAGWDHLQQATAVASYYVDMKDGEGWEPLRLQPLLASLLELVPWLVQWHNELDPVFGERMGDYYRGFVVEEAHALGFTLDDLRALKPIATTTKRGRRKKENA